VAQRCSYADYYRKDGTLLLPAGDQLTPATGARREIYDTFLMYVYLAK